MTDTKFDVLAIGNAIVDILVHTDDRFPKTHDLIKGTMGLVDLDASQSLYDKVRPTLECSGGSAANTIAGVASLGGRGASSVKSTTTNWGACLLRTCVPLACILRLRQRPTAPKRPPALSW